MEKKKILIVVGTRPNFVKVTQFKKEAENFPLLDVKIVHTGQHFDQKMADIFFEQFNLFPDYFLDANSNGVIKQFADIMIKLEELINNVYMPDLVIVVGDVNSTLAASLVANKLNIKIAHLEAGLRSWDMDMPEEINRILTDSITDFYFITEKSGLENLTNLNLSGKKFMVGNTMIDTLVAFEESIEASMVMQELNVAPGTFALVTIHRPSNVDSLESLLKIVELLEFIALSTKVVFPVHPRTKSKLFSFKLYDRLENNDHIRLSEPLSYFPIQKLIKESKYVVTDSGGIQEETTFRKKPCLTLRLNTERPSTIEVGTNELVNFEIEDIAHKIRQIENGSYKKGSVPEFWDGKATRRVLEILEKEL